MAGMRSNHKLLVGITASILCSLAAIGLTVGTKVYRSQSICSKLDRLEASYLWQHQTFDPQEPKSFRVREILANWLGGSYVSGLSVVSICHPNVDDNQLAFLKSLRSVKSLTLQSDQATDRTVELISNLPNLKYLTIVGEQFSVHGLLRLRQSPKLQRIEIDHGQLLPIELAVVKAELPGVLVSNLRTRDVPSEDSPSPSDASPYPASNGYFADSRPPGEAEATTL